jgi:hypothetical protein
MNPLLIARNLRTEYLRLLKTAFDPRQPELSRRVLRDKAERDARWQRAMSFCDNQGVTARGRPGGGDGGPLVDHEIKFAPETTPCRRD